MKIELEISEGQVKALVRFLEQETNGAFRNYCKKVEAGGIEILFDASLQTEHAQLAREWYTIEQNVKEQAKDLYK